MANAVHNGDFRSLLGRIFPYIHLLEQERVELRNEIRGLKEEQKSLLDRFARLSTGYAISEPMPNALEVARETAEIVKGRETNQEIMSRAEAMSLDLAEEMAGMTGQKREKQEKDEKIDPAVAILRRGE